MNQNTTNNFGLQGINSFITSNAKAANNTMNNTMSNIAGPINDSMNATKELTPSPFLTIPIIITLGILVVLFILIVVFREQIASSMDTLWLKIKGLFTKKPDVPSIPAIPTDIVPDQIISSKVLPGKKQVFNIAENKYTYSDAEPVCKAFGAELATYDQVKEAWNKGADWCNYGWVKGQAAIYPTQQSTFDQLQKGTEDQRMACGTPGVNGGYFDNPELRFGVNCYGVKPSENDNDIKNIMANNGDLTPEALAFDKKVLNYKAHMGEIPVNPFDMKAWSE